jgi:hypothetical protein
MGEAGGEQGDWDREGRRDCGRRGMKLGLGLDAAYIPRKHDENHWIDDR